VTAAKHFSGDLYNMKGTLVFNARPPQTVKSICPRVRVVSIVDSKSVWRLGWKKVGSCLTTKGKCLISSGENIFTRLYIPFRNVSHTFHSAQLLYAPVD